MKKSHKNFLASVAAASIISGEALACACGYGIASVGTSSLIPNGSGGLAFLQYDYINQEQNWYQNDKSDAANNDHKQVKSQIVTAGMQYMFNRDWGAAIRVPYVMRSTNMTAHDHHTMMDVDSKAKVNSVGDIRINGIYSGFSSDMSTGITFGLKLPTGEYKSHQLHDRAMQIGTGSTDSILGAYHIGQFSQESKMNWFVQGNWQHALMTKNGYRIGDEFSAATGVSYNAGRIAGIKKVAPILQVTGSRRMSDTGMNANKENSGYTQAYFAPAIELTMGNFRTYADVQFPIYRKTTGYQLVPNRIYKLIVGYNF